MTLWTTTTNTTVKSFVSSYHLFADLDTISFSSKFFIDFQETHINSNISEYINEWISIIPLHMNIYINDDLVFKAEANNTNILSIKQLNEITNNIINYINITKYINNKNNHTIYFENLLLKLSNHNNISSQQHKSSKIDCNGLLLFGWNSLSINKYDIQRTITDTFENQNDRFMGIAPYHD